MPLSLITPPAEEPVTLLEAKGHLRVDHSTDDGLIEIQIAAARQLIEAVTGRALVTQTWRLDLPAFPAEPEPIVLPRAPTASLTSVQYLDTNGTLTTLDAANYLLLADSGPTAGPAQLVPAYGVLWPATREQPNAVRITFVAGYGLAVAVPPPLKAAILLHVGDLYANREAATAGTEIAVNPTVDRLTAPYRTTFWG
jgi:uncharacterized phiE125 gp8 family phage protein